MDCGLFQGGPARAGPWRRSCCATARGCQRKKPSTRTPMAGPSTTGAAVVYRARRGPRGPADHSGRPGQATRVAPGITLTPHHAGHILGSAWVLLEFTGRGRSCTLAFTGHLGRPGRRLLRPPDLFTGADVLLVESGFRPISTGGTRSSAGLVPVRCSSWALRPWSYGSRSWRSVRSSRCGRLPH